jgi:hypothetical protein
MATDAQIDLFQALKTHKFELELIRGLNAGPHLEALDRRIEAARLLLIWLAQALEPHPPASPAFETPTPSSALDDQDQTPPPAPTKTPRS